MPTDIKKMTSYSIRVESLLTDLMETLMILGKVELIKTVLKANDVIIASKNVELILKILYCLLINISI